MNLAFIVNDVATEQEDYTTIRLARQAYTRGHTLALVGLADLIYGQSEKIFAMANVPTQNKYESDLELLQDLQSDENEQKRVCLSEYDVVMLRSDPAKEVVSRPWAPTSALLFAQLLVAQGVLVVNDPSRLTDASNKTYFQTYPDIIRPKTAIACNLEEIRQAVDDFGSKAVIKPLQGSGGQGVFVVNEANRSNLNQIIEATLRDGYAIVQEYLPRAAEGDLRLFTLNGRPLQVDGVYACFKRTNETDDARSNISAGGQMKPAAPDADALKIAHAAAPKLINDGMYLAGLDIVGDKMMEINVDTPGGLKFASDLTGVDFDGAVIDDLEKKVWLKALYGNRLTLSELSTM